PLGAEGLAGVALHPDVDEEGAAVLVDGDAAGVVVVVAVPVASHLGPQHPASPAGREDPHAGIPYISGRGGAWVGTVHHFPLGEGGQQAVPQVDPAAGVLGGEAVGVGVGPEI